MKFKKLIILFVVLGALVLLAVVKKTVVKPRAIPFEKAEEATLSELTPRITADFISKVIVYQGRSEAKKVVFSRNAAKEWIVENKFSAPARKNVPEELIKYLSGLKGELRTDSKAVFSDFQIADNEGLHIVLVNTADKEAVHLVVGLTKAAWNESFVRVLGAQKVFLVEKNFLMVLGLSSDPKAELRARSYLDLKIFPGDLAAAADRLEIKAAPAARPFVLKKSGEGPSAAAGWQLDPPDPRAPVDQARMDEFLRTISDLQARDVMDPNVTTYGFDKPTSTIIVNAKKKEVAVSYRLEIGNFDAAQKSYYARLVPGNIVYRLPEETAMFLKKDRSFFLQQASKGKQRGAAAGS
ncbi:hypothetical protein BU251_08670 [Candidatus Velamenicoccus archaeovorus]|uniref:DUF4340 domain-containing protein n=1 Tax=Velamenicoccus archaeovorus TaxID=1930593 RepID=A0A410P6H3_VELA1|nr:DUF4340 domain-containing protein [Candidatus Velamenicoccus archaeovorus]QAT17787.1 hypothetical protein BU251_08670 [Candidatus Velamenicoccus archaeovorus]